MPSSYCALYSHVIFSTKHREPWLREALRPRLFAYIGGIIRAEKGVLLAAGGIEDHVHLLIRDHQTVAMSDLMRDVKANSSRWIHETFDDLPMFGWQDGFAAFSVSASNLDDLRGYLAKQVDHHRAVPFKDELLAFLRKHEIEFDERYVFE